MRFYGLSLDEALDMSAEDEEMLWQAITAIEAQDALVSLQVVSYPNMKKTDQEKIHRHFHNFAYPNGTRDIKTLTAEEAMALFNG